MNASSVAAQPAAAVGAGACQSGLGFRDTLLSAASPAGSLAAACSAGASHADDGGEVMHAPAACVIQTADGSSTLPDGADVDVPAGNVDQGLPPAANCNGQQKQLPGPWNEVRYRGIAARVMHTAEKKLTGAPHSKLAQTTQQEQQTSMPVPNLLPAPLATPEHALAPAVLPALPQNASAGTLSGLAATAAAKASATVPGQQQRRLMPGDAPAQPATTDLVAKQSSDATGTSTTTWDGRDHNAVNGALPSKRDLQAGVFPVPAVHGTPAAEGATFAPSLLRPIQSGGSFSAQVSDALDEVHTVSQPAAVAVPVRHLNLSLTVPGIGDLSVSAAMKNGAVHATVLSAHSASSLLMADMHRFLEQNHVAVHHVAIQSADHRFTDIRGAPAGRTADTPTEGHRDQKRHRNGATYKPDLADQPEAETSSTDRSLPRAPIRRIPDAGQRLSILI